MQYYVADFETTTKEDDCRVWAYAVCEVGNVDNIILGTNITEFMEWCKGQKNVTVLFHNLRFDSQFIMSWLFKNGFQHVTKSADRASNTFTTLINDLGLYYAIEVIFYLKGKNVKKVTFQDSYKLIPLSVEDTAKAFKLPYQKGKIDYTAHDELPEGAPLTPEEEEYIKNDVRIIAQAVEHFHERGLNKMTIGACALDEYKKITTKKYFNLWYPPQDERFYYDVKQAYKGGFVYVNPKFIGKTIGRGFVLDVNALYSAQMKYAVLPYGTPIFYKGQYIEDELFPLYIQTIRCSFELKKGKIPTIQLKNSLSFRGNEYITSSNDAEEVLCLTSVDLELFLEHYNVYNLEYISGWKFKGTTGLFTEYIDKWNNSKIEAKNAENWGLYEISKRMLNALSGKFGTTMSVRPKIPYMESDGTVHLKRGPLEPKEGLYVATSAFITSYGRKYTISSAQKIQDDYYAGKSKIQFVYADTDSLHCISDDFELPIGLEINNTKLGAWKFEGAFVKAKFLRQKCYIEQMIIDEESYNEGLKSDFSNLYSKDEERYYKLKITVAGMPSACHSEVSFRKFRVGATFTGKKHPVIVNGGVILEEIPFTIVE